MSRSLWRTLAILCACSILIQGLDLADILKDIPEEERVPFLKYHVEHGYELKTPFDPRSAFGGYNNQFSIDLYDYFNLNHPVTDPDVIQGASKVVCFPDGSCVDLDDPGVHP